MIQNLLEQDKDLWAKADMNRGLTLIEIIISTAIVVLLMALVLAVLNPVEILSKSRDSRRVDDLDSLSKVLNQALSDKPTFTLAPTAQCSDEASPTIFVSVPSDNGESSPSNLPSGWSYGRVSSSTLYKLDSTGWVPVEFPSQGKEVLTLSRLPVDPVNSFSKNLFYSYTCRRASQKYEFNARFESKYYSASGSADKTSTDGGDDSYIYEIGTNLDLDPLAPVALWNLDEATGTKAYDTSGNSNNGTTTNMASPPTTTSGWQTSTCIKINCLAFDGTDDYVTVSNNNSINFGVNQNFTVAAWAKTTQAAALNLWPAIVSKEDAVATRNGYNLLLHDSNIDSRWYLEIFVSGTGYKVYGSTNVANGNWHYLVGVRSGSNIISYQDGLLATTTAASSGSVQKDIPLNVGRFSNGANYFSGAIDEIRIYNRALSTKEIEQQYKALQ